VSLKIEVDTMSNAMACVKSEMKAPIREPMIKIGKEREITNFGFSDPNTYLDFYQSLTMFGNSFLIRFLPIDVFGIAWRKF
jgi:hypothetical protein